MAAFTSNSVNAVTALGADSLRRHLRDQQPVRDPRASRRRWAGRSSPPTRPAGPRDLSCSATASGSAVFGGRPDILGTTLTLSGTPHVVVGVMPRGFDFPRRDIALWLPLWFEPRDLEDRTQRLPAGHRPARPRRDNRPGAGRAQRHRRGPGAGVPRGQRAHRRHRDRVARRGVAAVAADAAGAGRRLGVRAAHRLRQPGQPAPGPGGAAPARAGGAGGDGRPAAPHRAAGADREPGAVGRRRRCSACCWRGSRSRAWPRWSRPRCRSRRRPRPTCACWPWPALATLATGIGFGLVPAWRIGRGRARRRPACTAPACSAAKATERLRSAFVVAEVAAAVVLLVGGRPVPAGDVARAGRRSRLPRRGRAHGPHRPADAEVRPGRPRASSSSPGCCRTCAPCPACGAPPTPASCRW